MQRGFASLVLTLVLALAGMMFSACSSIDDAPRASVRPIAASPSAQRHRDATKTPARGPVLREHRHVVTTLSWDDDDDDDDELVPPFDTGNAPDDDDAAEGAFTLTEIPTVPPLDVQVHDPPLLRETRPRDPPRRIELPPPRLG